VTTRNGGGGTPRPANFSPDFYFTIAIVQKMTKNCESALTFRAASRNFPLRSID
jgi:hypothetical protein